MASAKVNFKWDSLLLVKQISTHTNHPVSVVSKQNEGTTFTIQFPDE